MRKSNQTGQIDG